MTYTDVTKLLELRLQMLGTTSPVKLLFGNREGRVIIVSPFVELYHVKRGCFSIASLELKFGAFLQPSVLQKPRGSNTEPHKTVLCPVEY